MCTWARPPATARGRQGASHSLKRKEQEATQAHTSLNRKAVLFQAHAKAAGSGAPSDEGTGGTPIPRGGRWEKGAARTPSLPCETWVSPRAGRVSFCFLFSFLFKFFASLNKFGILKKVYN